jgi:3-deoxy-manno-octulosonate cytidylyltransferase (CMP-KDO synthetase)
MMRTVVIIPARYESSRFPGKPLVKLLNKPMILWVCEICELAVKKENVYVATDDQNIENTVKKAGFNVVMTSKNCLTGTDRIAEAAQQITSDIYINVQGDEPTINPNDIIKIVNEKKRNMDEVINGYCLIGKEENPLNTNIPKVIFNEEKKLVYISRQAIPGTKDTKKSSIDYYKQVCIYAFTLGELDAYLRYGKKSTLEKLEDIEIIRFLELNKTIRMVETEPGSLAVDAPEDVKIVESRLSLLHHG